MSRIGKFMGYLSKSRRYDQPFEQYYGSLMVSRDGGPSAAEARRDFESIRRVMDKAIFY